MEPRVRSYAEHVVDVSGYRGFQALPQGVLKEEHAGLREFLSEERDNRLLLSRKLPLSRMQMTRERNTWLDFCSARRPDKQP